MMGVLLIILTSFWRCWTDQWLASGFLTAIDGSDILVEEDSLKSMLTTRQIRKSLWSFQRANINENEGPKNEYQMLKINNLTR